MKYRQTHARVSFVRALILSLYAATTGVPYFFPDTVLLLARGARVASGGEERQSQRRVSHPARVDHYLSGNFIRTGDASTENDICKSGIYLLPSPIVLIASLL